MMKLLSPAQKSSLEARFQTFGEKQQREKKVAKPLNEQQRWTTIEHKKPRQSGV
ncbi:hypothetical protein [Kosakonia cowanii]|uniref:hypothetical protein n=1 Tax=Kosakonia cowanii TaxID=208223 RepID=UPI002731EA76|nr:hypothetical protein [Kosakonia cowanii]WKW44090.1 hypothetical protein PZO50_09095 [Kosakonia cowanii]